MAAEDDVLLAERERLAGRDADLLADDVDARHELRDRVLDLEARVHLEEEEALADEQPLDRAGAAVADRARGLDGDRADPLAQRRRDRRPGRLLDELLVAPLDRAVALAEVDDVAVRVREDLHLDVARILEVLLDVDVGVREEALALGRCPLERARALLLRERDVEALAAAAARGLEGDGEADRARRRERLLRASASGVIVPGTTGTPASSISRRAVVLTPMLSIASGGGPTKTQARRARTRARSRRARRRSRSRDGSPPRRWTRAASRIASMSR